MALVTRITEEVKETRAPHKQTDCTATIATGSDGKRYLQLDTYGSTDRQQPNKLNQSLQFSRSSAESLLNLLRKAFPDLG